MQPSTTETRPARDQLTGNRKAVLLLMQQQQGALSAYENIDLLRPQIGRIIHPILVYRCLDFLLAKQLILKLVSVNKFIALPEEMNEHWPVPDLRTLSGCDLFSKLKFAATAKTQNCSLRF